MALELVGGALLSASLQVLFDRLASPEAVKFGRGQKLSDELLNKLKRKLLIVHAVINDAEVKQFSDQRVREWLDQVKDVVYEAEDLLDEIATEVLRLQIEAADSQTGVWNRFSTLVKAPFANQSIEGRVKEMIAKLEDIAQEKDKLGLKEGVGEKLSPRTPSTSLVDESSVYGRVEIKEEMVKRLCSDNAGGNNIDVISVVGMGGSGKTTLAQLLYNDERVEEHFPLKAWVCVSEEFIVLRITRLILEGIRCATPSDMQSGNLDSLQLKLKESLGNKKFLLVLDDVWEKGCSEWDQLRIPLLAAGKGSKVVVTTRDQNVATTMRAVLTHPLKGLSDADCWSLFQKLAFENGDSSPYPQLESIGRKIVAKCGGLPLAVKALGSLLYSKADRREWEEILESEIWGFKIRGILPSLILSYHDLPLYLKRCFAYCSIFPKDHEFDKEKLILLWMAEGLLQFPQHNQRMEEVGEWYFDELLSKSFFSKSITKESCFVMHDLIHDLAQYISGKFCIRLEDDKFPEIPRTVRHSLYFETNYLNIRPPFKRFQALTTLKCLRTHLELKDGMNQMGKRVNLHDIFPKWRYLRVLSLCYYRSFDLPESIGKLKHLRYLDLSFTEITKLPDSVCDLYNLQTLLLSGRYHFKELPSRMDKLINLRYLDISGCRRLPSHISQLKSLQKLSDFIVGQEGGVSIGELEKLSDIRGRLRISEIQNVVYAKDALQAKMKDKTHLDELSLEWTILDKSSGVPDDILKNLEPYSNLEQLNIINYPGLKFPDWVGHRSLVSLVSLKLEVCYNCSSLPPLGQLPSLKHLWISRINGVERVGSEFYGDVSSSFPSLQTLRFRDMRNWEKWLCCELRHQEFPRLQELDILDCPKLTGKLPEELCSLKKLKIVGCEQLLVASLQVPAIRELEMMNFGKLQLKRPASGFTALQTSDIMISKSQWKQLPLEPHKLTIIDPDAVESLLEEGILQTPTSPMQDLIIWGCHFSRSLHKVCLPTTLKSLEIFCYRELGFLLPELFRCHHPSLEELKIGCIDRFCPSSSFSLSISLAFFPRLIRFDIDALNGLESLSISISAGEPTSLRSLKIKGCHNLGYIELPTLYWACYDILNCRKLKLLNFLAHTLSPLQRLSLKDCPQLLFQKDGLSSNLHELKVYRCNQLTPQVDWGLQRLTSLTKFIIRGGCLDVESFPEECLLPSTLTSLVISGLPNLKSLDGRGLQLLTSLTKLSLRFCPKLQFLPQEGFQHFPSLIELEIIDCPGLQSFGEEMFRHLTSLKRLFMSRCHALQSLIEVGLQHLTSLKQLYIHGFPELQSLTEVGLQHLTSLERLSIENCPKLQYLTKKRLPDSLSFLEIGGCPLLEQRCRFGKGQEWCYIAHIPQVYINYVEF